MRESGNRVQRKRTKQIVWILLIFFPIAGLLGTAVWLRGEFARLEPSGTGDPQPVSAPIGYVLIPAIFGLIGFAAGVVLLVFSIVSQVRLERAEASQPPPALS